MSKHEKVPALTPQEVSDYQIALLEQGNVLLRHPQVVRSLVKSKKKLGNALLALVPKTDAAPALVEWQEFYKKVFDLDVDLSAVAIPAQQPGFDRLVVVAHGVSMNQAMIACKDRFKTWQYTNDLDASVTKNDRTAATGPYAVWVRDRVEADEETQNLSADQLAEQKLPGMTLLERIILELHYFDRTGSHLDVQNLTLCAGSRYSDGYVPRCYWYSGGFGVYWYVVSHRDPSLRSRVVVS